MSNLVKRTIFGTLYVAIIVGAILGGDTWFDLLILVLAALASSELYHIIIPKPIHAVGRVCRLVDVAIATLIALIPASSVIGFAKIYLLVPIVFGLGLLRLVLAVFDKRPKAFNALTRSFFGALYIGLPLMSLMFIYALPYEIGKYLTLILFIMIWLNDTGAFIVGCTIGQHKMCERLSPKKSWEGFWGGFTFCLLSALIGYIVLPPFIPLLWWIALGVVVCLFATWGDLLESMIKRTFSIKDSGNIIPGHGGILDRIDSLLFVAPAVLLLVFIAVLCGAVTWVPA